MGAPRLDAARALLEDVRAALDAATLPKAVATINGAEVPSGARHGVVLIAPPSLRFEDWETPTAIWELHIVAGPANNYLAAWEVIDTIIQALHAAHINIQRGEPGAFAPQNGPQLPAYTLTLNPLD